LLEGELPSIFHYAAEGRHGASPGVTSVKTLAGTVLTDPDAVQNEILSYFDALFNGRHQTAADRPEPFDSGQPFTPDVDRIPAFLDGLPRLEPAQAAALEAPFTLPELRAAVAGAEAAKSPGLDSLS
jgi:hypothetical protein